MQETFIKAYRHLHQFRRESRFTTWLTRIAVNESFFSDANRERTMYLWTNRLPLCRTIARAALSLGPHDTEKLYTKQELRELVEKAIRIRCPRSTGRP